jgi:hypothetical protein
MAPTWQRHLAVEFRQRLFALMIELALADVTAEALACYR